VNRLAALAVADDLISDEDDLDIEFDELGGHDSSEWRVERRYRIRQDGHKIMYWNLRRRKINRIDGKQRVEYRKGGSRIVS
jgi:hypothetical protein